MTDYTPEEKRAALGLAIKLISKEWEDYANRTYRKVHLIYEQDEYQIGIYKQSIAILEQMREEVEDG